MESIGVNSKREREEFLALSYRENEIEYHRISNEALRFDFSMLEKSANIDESLLYEFKRFMILKALHSDTSASIISPSWPVDEVWHKMILHLRDYLNLSNLLLPTACVERVIDHNPDGVNEGLEQQRRYRRALEAYKTFFKEAPPKRLWPPVVPASSTSTSSISSQQEQKKSKPNADDSITISVRHMDGSILAFKVISFCIPVTALSISY